MKAVAGGTLQLVMQTEIQTWNIVVWK